MRNVAPSQPRFPQLILSRCRRLPRLMNLTFRRSFVRIVSPVNGILLRIPVLCRTENLPKLPSFNVNPFVSRLLSRVASSAATTVSMTFRLASWSAAPTLAEPSQSTHLDLLDWLACSSSPFERKCLHAEQYRRSRESGYKFCQFFC